MPANRFDFEQQIMSCWNVVDDLKQINEGFLDGWLDFNLDNVSNRISGVANLYEVKFNKLWNLFESVMMEEVRKNKMLEEECSALRNEIVEINNASER